MKLEIKSIQQIILDKDLAAFYQVKPIRLREQVSRNPNRFPPDFVFQLTEYEVDSMLSQNAIPSRQSLGGSLPLVFTEQGVAAVAGVLKTELYHIGASLKDLGNKWFAFSKMDHLTEVVLSRLKDTG